MSRRDLLVILGLIVLAALFFFPVVFAGRVLVPFDSLYRFPPWNAFAEQFGVTTPHNELVLDLVLENYAWKHLIVESLRAGEIPLWNPYLFAGIPFFAAGQHSALYPASILFYVLPIDRAFGYFVALQIAFAAITMYALVRVLGLERLPAVLSGIVYALSGFMVVSTTFPMVISAAAWLPAILAFTELVLRSRAPRRQILYALLGALCLGVQFLAGHVEISLYILIITAYFALWRAIAHNRCVPQGIHLGARGLVGIGLMTGIGVALGAVQLIPLYEIVQANFRGGSVSLQDVLGWAYPSRQILTFFMPDFFGNPTHHSYLDVFDGTLHAAPAGTIFWGIKNYVEAGSYVGILPLILAFLAIVAAIRAWRNRDRTGTAAPGSPDTSAAMDAGLVALFAVLAVVSLLFTFGTPLYAILFYGMPGFNQLHSPFRWVFPYTLSVALLAGIGANVLTTSARRWAAAHDGRPAGTDHAQRGVRTMAWICVAGGVAIVAGLVLAWILRTPSLAFLDRVVQSSSSLANAFDSGRMFFSYEARNLVLLALNLIGAGIVLHTAAAHRTLPDRWGNLVVWGPLALVLIAADLFVVGTGFYPTVDSRLKDFTPPAIEFLRQDPSLFRITSYDARGGPEEKVLNPNAGMLYDLADIRGYDSIIPKQYADLMRQLAPQDELLNNRIAPFYSPDPLSSPLIDLLNVKYVLTKRPLPNAGYTLVYDQEIQIYRNDRVLPRAFMVPQARVVADRAALLGQVTEFDPAAEVLIEIEPEPADREPGGAGCRYNPVTVDRYGNSEVILKSDQACGGWLVLSDSYFPGWIAQVDGLDVSIYRADYNFRAVHLPAGAHTIRFKYSPLSFRIGLIVSFLGGMVTLLGFAYLAWRRFYHAENASAVHVVAKNSLLPMATSLLMKFMDLAFAFFSLRVLGPTGTGRYAWAVGIWLLANTITDFGLGILLTREVSRDRSQANRFLSNSLVLRVALWTLSLIPFGLVAALYVAFFNVTIDTALALALLLLGLLPSTLSASLAFLFNAYERFEYRVAVDVVTRLVSITLGVIALVLGYGYVGLAAASILTNLFTLVVFYGLVRRTLFVPRFEFDRSLVRWMASESYPLMINNLLSSLFFRIDALILQPVKGDTVLGYYSTAYKFIEALNFIPSNFTLAIFPALSRMASSGKDAMLRAYVISLRLLLWISLPITVGTIFVARELIQFFGGTAYLPHSAIALQVLIWFLPFSFVNSVTHYVLIALGQQRFLTKAFVIGVLFNVAANLAAIPPLGYVGAALVTILSEVVLLFPFYYCVHKNLAAIPFASIVWRPALASAIMGVALWWMVANLGLIVAVPLAGVLYVALLFALGAVGPDERFLLRRLVPERWHTLLRLG